MRFFPVYWYNINIRCVKDGGDRFSQFVCELFNNATRYVVWTLGPGRFDGEQLLADFVGLRR